MGIASSWWELSLYRSETGSFVLASVFYLNFPRHRTLRGAVVFENIADVRDHLVNACSGPAMSADRLPGRVHRQIRHLDDSIPPLPQFAPVPEYEPREESEVFYVRRHTTTAMPRPEGMGRRHANGGHAAVSDC